MAHRPPARAVARLLGMWFAVFALLSFRLAHAEESDAGPSDRAQLASEAFSQGQRAYAANDYLAAAQAFETSYQLLPHHDALWNGAQSWLKVGERSRAATRLAQYLHESPVDAKDRDVAIRTLHELESTLGRLDIHLDGLTDPRLDDEPLSVGVVYVYPGAHTLGARIGTQAVEQLVRLEAGEVRSVVLLPAPRSVPPNPLTAASAPGFTSLDLHSPLRVLPRMVVYAGAGATLVAGGVAVWSGVDTWVAAANYDRTQAKLEQGLGKERRTNVLYGVAGGLATLTTVAAVWFVDWRSPAAHVGVRMSPNALELAGIF